MQHLIVVLMDSYKANARTGMSNKQWRAEGGANGATAPGIQGRGASKE